jgi:hypothetical protein
MKAVDRHVFNHDLLCMCPLGVSLTDVIIPSVRQTVAEALQMVQRTHVSNYMKLSEVASSYKQTPCPVIDSIPVPLHESTN